MVLASGDNPAGFDGVRRHSMLRGFRRWMSVLEVDTSPRGQLLTWDRSPTQRSSRSAD
jgi:hypothetical protein